MKKRLALMAGWVLLVLNGGYSQDRFDQIKELIPDQIELADSLAKEFYLEVKSEENEALSLKAAYLLGLTNYFQGKLYLSTKYYREALDQEAIHDFPDLEEFCWNNLGINFELQNNIELAEEAYLKSFAFAEKKGDLRGMAQTRINFGLLELKSQNPDKGIAYFQQALDYFQQEKDTLHIALCLQNIGVAYRNKQNWDELENFSRQARTLFTSANYPYGIADGLVNEGFAALNKGRFQQAESFFQQALVISEKEGFLQKKAVILMNLADLETERGAYTLALDQYRRSISLMKELGLYEQMDEAYLGRMKAAALGGANDLYEELLLEYKMNEDTRISREAVARHDELKIVYETEARLRTIAAQEEEIRAGRRRIIFLIIVLGLSLAGGLLVGSLYLRTRFLMQKLYLKNELLLKQWSQMEGPKVGAESSEEDEKIKELFEKIEHLMNSKALYRDANLTLKSLSQLLVTNVTYVSKAINNHSNSNFNSYVNHYRVNVAQNLLNDDQNELSMKDIGEYCGFNSYSTFNRIFKQETGLTPSQYKEQANSRDI
jgi:AraC-like DNA-binding protein